MQFSRRPEESATQMRSRMANLLEALPNLLTSNDAAQRYLSQFPFHEKRQIQMQLIMRHGNTDFTFQQAAQEAVNQERFFAYLDSRDPITQASRGDTVTHFTDPMASSSRPAYRNNPSHLTARKPRQPAATVRAAPSTTGQAQLRAAAPLPLGNGKRCHRCGDPSHLANACTHAELQCHHCQSKGLPGRGHLDRTCFALHPELIPNYRRPRNSVAYAAVTDAPPPNADASLEERLAEATNASFKIDRSVMQADLTDRMYVC